MDIVTSRAQQANFIVFDPVRPGHILATIDSHGKLKKTAGELNQPSTVSIDHKAWDYLISQIKRGVATKRARNLICIPATHKNGNLSARQKDATTLGRLLSKAKNRGSNIGLTTIAPENRWKGKVDWEVKRPVISQWMNNGKSVSMVARRLGVSPSTLSKANKRFNFYVPKRPLCQ